MIPWEIQGRELINCNCSYGCPCQFNAPPTHGHCQAIGWFSIEHGHYGAISLDGLAAGMAVQWPGPIHKGRGHCQRFIDARASADQREALLNIMSGQDTDPFATVFAVFATTFEAVYEPIFATIDLEIDVEARKGRAQAAHLASTHAQPIRNPVTGIEHRARIDLPHGFEYELAEIGSGTSVARTSVQIDVNDSYAQFAYIHLNNHGVVRHRPHAA